MGKERRDYPEICAAALKTLDSGPKTVNEVASTLEAGWVTVDRALAFLESLGHVEKVVKRPKVYRRTRVMPVSDGFINDLSIIIKSKGSRYHSLQECLDEALRDFIRRERSIKRY